MAWGRPRRRSYESAHDVRWLVAGLGNPGTEYEGTPHNVGFRVADALRAAHRIPTVAKHDGLFGVGAMGEAEGDVAVLTPLTYMNLSGRSVKPALAASKLDASGLLVVHDEIDLPFGAVQVKHGGGLAGHNGLKSIAELIGTRDFTRVRVGVGRPEPGDRRPVRDYVLAPWSQPASEVDALVDDARAAVELVITRGLRTAMNRVNARSARD